MLTRGRKARVAVRPEAAHAALPPLPLPCVLDILSRLAPGERLLASAVSRGWRAAVSQPSLWASVDLTREAAFPHTATYALLAAVVSKAAGQIVSLRLCLCENGVSPDAVLAAVKANAGALRWLGVRSTPFRASFEEDNWRVLRKGEVDKVLLAGSGLRSFESDVVCTFQDAQTLLTGQGQYNVMRLQRLCMQNCSGDEATALLPCLPPSLQELGIWATPVDTPAVLGALVDAAIACGLSGLYFVGCKLGPQSAAHLARLLCDAPRLSTSLIDGDDVLLDRASVAIFAPAVRNSLLTVLRLDQVGLWVHEGVGNVVVDALVGHPTLQELSLAHNSINFADSQNTVGAC